MALAAFEEKVSQPKLPKGGTKRVFVPGGTEAEAQPVKNLQNAGDVKNDTASL
jgi:hypothetical protein